MSDARRDRRQNRRFAAGGSGHDRRDPRDIEIERLNQRIRELELIQQPFEDLYQRDDEDDRTVTDSVVWDDLAGTCDVNYDSPPLYDVYEDEEWYSWFNGEYTVAVSGNSVATSEDELGNGDETQSLVAMGGDAPDLEVPILWPSNTESLNFKLHKISFPTNLEFKIESNFKIGDRMVNSKKMDYVEFMQGGKCINGHPLGYRYCDLGVGQHEKKLEAPYNFIGPPSIIKNSGLSNLLFHDNGMVFEPGKTRVTFWDYDIRLQLKIKSTGSQPKPNAKKASHLDSDLRQGQLDPGGLFERVKLNENETQPVFPFDPGGYGPKSKLEDEFFRRGGE